MCIRDRAAVEQVAADDRASPGAAERRQHMFVRPSRRERAVDEEVLGHGAIVTASRGVGVDGLERGWVAP